MISALRRVFAYGWIDSPWRVMAMSLLCSLILALWQAPSYGLLPPLEIRNTSLSVPLGWYRYTTKWPPERGDIIMMHDPPGYLLNWLMKRVEGVGGDRYCWRASEMRHYINDRPMPVIPKEAVARGLPIWRGCRSIMTDEIVGYGDHVFAYGSQYIGPTRFEKLWGVYVRFW